MQRQAAEDLKRLVTDALVERNLLYEGAQSFVTPRRLTLHVVGLPAAQPDLREERKGPRVGAPDAAIQGFLKSAGLEPHRGRADRDRPEEGPVLCRADREAGARDQGRHRRDHARRSSARSRGRNRCAGARPRRSPTPCAGCARCAASCARSRPNTRRRRSSRSILTTWAHVRRHDLGPSLHGARADPCPPL